MGKNPCFGKLVKCPNCKTEIHCGCKSCLAANQGKNLFVATENDNFKCTNCNHQMHGNDWLDEEWEQYRDSMASAKNLLNVILDNEG